MLQSIESHKQIIWYDASLIINPTSEHFEGEYWQQLGKVVGSAQGRGTTWFVQLDGIQAALRHYCRGGLFGKLVKDHYWFTGWENTRCYQELLLLKHLRAAGVNVPRPIAAIAKKRTVCYQADILSEKIANARDLVTILQDSNLSAETYCSIGEQIRLMHNAGVNHTDLNIHNILLDSEYKVWIIDFDKCAKQGSEQWKAANLERLLRSFNKELHKRAIHWQQSDWNALLAGYRSYKI